MARFDTLFKKYVKHTDYKYDSDKSLAWNESHLKKMASLENSCRTLYDKLDSTFGEEYAELVTTNVLNKNFVITQLDKYPLSEYPNIAERVLLVDYLNYAPLYKPVGGYTLLNFYSSAMRDILSAVKIGASIELYDFFICTSLMIEKWRITEYPKYITKRKVDVEAVLKQFVKTVICSMFCRKEEMQNITLSLLDKRLFDEAIKGHDYSVELDKETKERLKATYDIYLSGVRMFLDIIKSIGNSQEYTPPAIRTYAVASSKLNAEILECIEGETGVNIGVIYDIFRDVNFDAMPQCLDSTEYREAFDKLEELHSTRKKNFAAIRWKINDMFKTDYICYLNVCCKKLAYLLKEYELEKIIPSYETIYYKSNYDWISPLVKGKFSEVTIKAEYVTKDCQSEEEFKKRLYKAVIDAQTINIMRGSIILRKGIKPPRSCVLNVKLDGLDESLNSIACNVMNKANNYLASTYKLNFTYEISQRVFFRDKTRVCYLLL